MSIAEAETATRTPSHWEVLLRAWKQLNLPEGWRAEIIEGDIIITLSAGVAESMSIAEAEALGIPSRWEVVLRAWEELDLPEGWQAEIIEGDITIMTPPKYGHNVIVSSIQREIYREVLRPGSQIAKAELHQAQDIRVPLTDSLYIPDLMVLPETAPDPGTENPAADAILLVEVTSRSTASKDRKAKLWGYAHAGVPLYLLVDRWDPEASGRATTTLFAEPDRGVYKHVEKVFFGEAIKLPTPFDLVLDTSEFPGSEEG
ncbi:Uma2 family endonuclease [Nocardiopsis sp. CNS-639]|uniref:Uma2 family endonuclease n=1 Tax=Nocardiopsis sp. CNS-639 TaxID=1169153 RepID=UPI000367DB91|nr:Uma2 family endonuclease [Nocardiopsis sp. CNS-639]